MHILIIPSEVYGSPAFPLAGIFQRDQVHALRSGGFQVGVLSVHRYSLKGLYKARSCYETKILDSGLAISKHHYKRLMPVRYKNMNVLAAEYQKKGLKLFEQYVKYHGMPDIVHAHNIFYAGFIALAIKKQYQIPYLITEHSSMYARRVLKSAQVEAARVVCDEASEITAVSKGLGSRLKSTLNFSGRVKVLPNVLGAEFCISALEKKVNYEPGKRFRFVNVASLDSNKNHKDLIAAFAQVFKGNDSVHLDIAGEGANKQAIQLQINTLGLGRQVRLLGRMSRDELCSLLRRSNVFVLSSYVETFGVVLIEALSQGLPVVATKTSGGLSIVNASNGLLVELGNVEELAKGMQYLYANYKQYHPTAISKLALEEYGIKQYLANFKSLVSQ